MKKYLHVINIGIQNLLVYRVNFLVRALFGLLPLAATLSLWRTVYEGRSDTVGGYTLAQMVSYYLVVTLVDMLTAVTDDDWQIAADIRDGNISQFLLKPIDYLTYRFCLFGAGRLIYTTVALVPVALFILLQRQYFVLPADLATFGWFAVSVVMTALLQFLISYSLALLAFWFLEISTFIFIVFAFEYIAGGHLFPLDILPPVLAQVLSYTPFPYQLSLRQVDLGGFVNAASAVAVIAYALSQLGVVPSVLEVVGFVLLGGVGVLVHYALMFLLATISFWTVRAQGIVWGYYSLFNIARLPDAAFRGFFTYAVPMLLVANVPARLLADKLASPWPMLLLLLTGLACGVASEAAWRFSVRRYTSASS